MYAKDELTGLMCRDEFTAGFEQALALAGQQDQSLALVFFDIDHLLHFNNTYGHVGGDEAIRQVGQTLSDVLQDSVDASLGGEVLLGRIGGDEFAVALPGVTAEQAVTLATRALQMVEEAGVELAAEGDLRRVDSTISAGLAFYPVDGITSTELARKGREAMLRAKEAGSNRVAVYTEGGERDALTAVLTRYAFTSQFDQSTEQAVRERGSLSLICLDIDDFAALNQQYGRYAGDEILRRVATVLSSNFKEDGFVGRISGDEFAVMLPGARAETAFVLAEEARKLVEDLEIPVQVGEQKLRLWVRISGGIAEYPADGSERVDLFRRAEEALYRAKHLGRNRICLPVTAQMVTKTSHFTQTQLEKLSSLSKQTGKSEAALLREALDDLLRNYEAGR